MLNEILVKAPAVSHVYGYSTSTTHQVYEVPAEWKGQRVAIQAVTANLWISFGTSASIEVDRTDNSTLATNTLTVSAKTGAYVAAGTKQEFVVDTALTHFAIEADNTGTWRGWMSDPA